MKLLKKEVFDINKVTVVGSPTITEYGVASGFSDVDYLSKTISLDSFTTFDLVFKFKTPETITTPNQVIGNSSTYPVINYRLSATRTVFCEFSISSATRHYATSSIALKENTDYYGKISYDKSAVKFYYSENGIDFNILRTLNNITDFNGIYDFAVGMGRALGNVAYAYPFQGSIDLPSFKVFVDGKEIYNTLKPTYLMEKRKEGFDLSKFTVVGSPTITEGGVLSNCSSNNIVQTPPINITNPNWEFNFVIDTNGMSGNVGVLGIPSVGFCYINANTTNQLCTIYLVQQWDGGGAVSIGSLALNKKYQIVWGMNGTTHYSKLKEFGATEWLKEGSKTYETVKTTSSAISIGRDTTNNLYLTNGSIDLTQFSITVDNKEVFTGAKVNYYAMR